MPSLLSLSFFKPFSKYLPETPTNKFKVPCLFYRPLPELHEIPFVLIIVRATICHVTSLYGSVTVLIKISLLCSQPVWIHSWHCLWQTLKLSCPVADTACTGFCSHLASSVVGGQQHLRAAPLGELMTENGRLGVATSLACFS